MPNYLGNTPFTKATMDTQEYVATEGQTVLACTYKPNFVDVYRNGVLLAADDFSADDGTSITFTSPLTSLDVITVRSWSTFTPTEYLEATTERSGAVEKATHPEAVEGAVDKFPDAAGVHAAFNQFGLGTLNYKHWPTNSLDDHVPSGWYYAQTDKGFPFSPDGIVWTHNYSNVWTVQEAYDFRSSRTMRRSQNNGVWLPWQDFHHTGNGASSAEALAGTDLTKWMSPARVHEAFSDRSDKTFLTDWFDGAVDVTACTLYTPININEERMYQLEIQLSVVGYTNYISAVLSFYIYQNSVYLPKLYIEGTETELRAMWHYDATYGLKFIFNFPASYYPTMRLYGIRYSAINGLPLDWYRANANGFVFNTGNFTTFVENIPRTVGFNSGNGASSAEALAGTDLNKWMSPARVHEAFQQFGLGGLRDLRTTVYVTGVPSDFFGKGTAFGFADGAALGIPGLSVYNYGTLEYSYQWTDASGYASAYRKFTTGVHGYPRCFIQTAVSASLWSPWVELHHSGNMQPDLSSGLNSPRLMRNTGSSPVFNQDTASGSVLRYCDFSTTGVLTASTTSASGTWKNISGTTIVENEYGLFVRIA